jgi:hypothetical protein
MALGTAESLRPGAGNQNSRLMHELLGGAGRFAPRSMVDEQGLLHLYTAWCAARRCYECPVAAAAVAAGAVPRLAAQPDGGLGQ